MTWLDLVPIQFHHVSGLRRHAFRTSYPHVLHGNTSLPVTLVRKGGTTSIVVTAAASPDIFEALRLLGSVDGETNRELRYMTVHNAHEALLGAPPMEARAIRHSFAHASTELRDPAVVASLNARFGNTRVDFGQHSHKREVFRCLGGMLIALDTGLYRALEARYNQRFQATPSPCGLGRT